MEGGARQCERTGQRREFRRAPHSREPSRRPCQEPGACRNNCNLASSFQMHFGNNKEKNQTRHWAAGRELVATGTSAPWCRTNERKSRVTFWNLHCVPEGRKGPWIPSPDQWDSSDQCRSVSGVLLGASNFPRNPSCCVTTGHFSLAMISVTIFPDGKPLSLAPSLPISVEVKENASVIDVKTAIAAKFPRVGRDRCLTCHNI